MIQEAFKWNMAEGQARGVWYGAAGYDGGSYIYKGDSGGGHMIGYTHGIDFKNPATFDQATYDAKRGQSPQAVLLNDKEAYKKLTSVGYIDAVTQAGRLLKMAELIEKTGVNPAGLKIDSLVNTTNGPTHLVEGQPSPTRLRDLARWLIASSWNTHSPVALDLNHDGKIGVTGTSTAQRRMKWNKFVPENAVWFDILANGKKQHIEWLNGDGDGFLVDDTNGRVSKAAAGKGEIDAHSLFGDAIGYANGYHKLAYKAVRIQLASAAKLDASTAWATLYQKKPVLEGKVLDSLKVWIDGNRDAKVQKGELHALSSLGITEVGSTPQVIKNESGEYLIRSYYIQNGKRHMTEDVWFAADPATETK